MDDVECLTHRRGISEGLERRFLLACEDAPDIVVDGLLELRLAQRTGVGELAGSQIGAPHKHIAVFQQIGELLLVGIDGVIRLANLNVVMYLVEIHGALGGDVACSDHIGVHLSLLVEYGAYADFNEFVEVYLRVVHVTAEV